MVMTSGPTLYHCDYFLSSRLKNIMLSIRGTTASTIDLTPAAANCICPENRLGFFANRLLTVHHHTESLLSFVVLFGRVTQCSLPRLRPGKTNRMCVEIPLTPSGISPLKERRLPWTSPPLITKPLFVSPRRFP
jgi:hypothetical protein